MTRLGTWRRGAPGMIGLLFVIGASFLLSGCEAPAACTHQWVGPTNGNFGVAANWDVGTVPGASGVACAPNGSTIEITDHRTVRRVGLPTSALHVSATGSLTTTSASNAKTLTTEGALDGTFIAGYLHVGGNASFTGNSLVAAAYTATITGAPTLHDGVRLWMHGQANLDHATIQACDDASLRIDGVEVSSASSVTTAGCATVGSSSIQSVIGWEHDGDLRSDIPVVVLGCRTDLRGTLTAPSYRQLGGDGCPEPITTVVSPSSVLTFGQLHLDTGRITGAGTVNANVDGAGELAPGLFAPRSTLTINGDYHPSAGAAITVRVWFAGGVRSDVVNVTGAASLDDASLTVSVGSGGGPATVGATFRPLVAGSSTGAFASVVVPTTVPSWGTTYTATGPVLTTIGSLPTLTWPTPGAIKAGTPLSSAELNATASVPGTFVYSPAAGTALSAGPNQPLSVTFHPTDTATYTDATASTTVNVTATAPTVTWTNPAPIGTWTTLGAAQLNATASVPGTFFYSPSAGTLLRPGLAQPLSVLFVPTDRATYPSVRRTVSIDVNAAPPVDAFRSQENTVGTAWDVATADLDGDGRSDVVTVDSTPTVAVLLRTSSGAFAPRATYVAGTRATRVSIGDVDGDRRPDLVVLDRDANSIAVLLGTGGGAFAPSIASPTLTAASSIAVGDLNGDGRLDVVVGNGSALAVMWGTGTGTFRPPTTLPMVGVVSMVRIADLNGDGRADLATVSSLGTSVSVTLSTGGGGFGPTVRYPTGKIQYALAVGDVNGDTKPDLVVGFQGVAVLAGAGDGTFGAIAPVASLSSTQPHDVLLADLDGDGIQDMVLPNGAGQVHIARGAGGGSFVLSPPYLFGQGNTSYEGVLGDIDGDHRPDFVGGGYGVTSVLLGARATTVSWNTPAALLVGTPLSATQLNATASVPGTFSYTPAAGTILAAGRGQVLRVTFTPTDAATYLPATATVTIDVYAHGDLAPPTYVAATTPREATLRDLNGDTKVDLVYLHSAPDALAVRLGTGTGTFGPPVDYPVVTTPTSLALGDVTGDGRIDAVVVNGNGTNRLSVLPANGPGTFGARVDYTTGASPGQVVLGDVNGDGRLDAITANTGADTISLFLGTPSGAFAARSDLATVVALTGLSAGDLNGDGRADLVTANNAYKVTVFLGSATGLTRQADVVQNPRSFVTLVDTGPDGKLDLVSNTGLGVTIIRGNGDGTFDTAHPYTVAADAFVIRVADISGDGKLDVVTSSAASRSVSVLLGNGSGVFGPLVSYSTGFGTNVGANALTLGDVNGDGRPDVVTTTGNGSIAIFLAY